ncbi:MAG TPA: alpha/beta hydrolase [Polyangiaceae bacterium]|nr:alpha/beta hydrolase [Polyangiaceae bacterium]
MTAFSPGLRAFASTGRHVNVGRHRLFVIERGQGPTLILMHGFPTACFDYRALMDRLAPHFRCITFDFPGYGLSDKPVDYSYSLFQQADAVEALARALGIQSASVVCHDVSTSVACELLARRETGRLGFALRHVVFTNGSLLQWRATITPFQELLASNASLLQGMEVCARFPAFYGPGLRTIMKRPETFSADDEAILTELLVHDDGHLRLPALAGYMRERYVHRERWIGALERSAAIVSFVWAEDDPVANVALGRELHALVPSAPYVELDDVGHFVVFEDPDRVAAAVIRSAAPA